VAIPAFLRFESRIIVPLVCRNSRPSHSIAITDQDIFSRFHDFHAFIYSGTYNGCFVGNRCSVVHFTHQAVHDAYVEKAGKPFWEFNKMHKWWQKLRMHLNV